MRPTDDAETTEILARYRAQLTAMTGGDVSALDVLLADEFTLTHITGYMQPKIEWLAEMSAGQFRYHRIDERGVDVDIDAAGGAGRLVGRFVVDATVYGSRATWRLQLDQTYGQRGGAWRAMRSVATLW